MVVGAWDGENKRGFRERWMVDSLYLSAAPMEKNKRKGYVDI